MNRGTRWTLFCLIFTLLSVHSVSRLLGPWIKPQLDVHYQRLEEILENLGDIAGNPRSTTLFFGNSIFQFFLDPNTYDNEMRELGNSSSSYNLAFAGHMGLPTLAFVQRFGSELPPKTMFRESIFEISPISYAKRFHHDSSYALDVERPAIFLSARMWPSFFLSEPEIALNAAFNYFLKPFDWCALPPIRDRLANWTFWPLSIPDYPTDPPFRDRVQWQAATKGRSNWNFPEAKIEFDDLMVHFRCSVSPT